MKNTALNHDTLGSASLAAVMTLTLLLGLSAAMLKLSLSSHDERESAVDHHKALFVADAGISHAVANLGVDVEDDMGSAAAPVVFSDGGYWFDVQPNADDTYTITSVGDVRGERVALEAVVRPPSGGIFDNAIFAGNTSDDPFYTLGLGGKLSQADEILGNVYSGGNVSIVDDATVSGAVRAVGNVFGDGESAAPVQSVPDLISPDYSATADIMVKDLFDAAVSDGSAMRAWDDAGGSAWQLPKDSPAHIFRLNPDDRRSETLSTEKDDYFLEDPYEDVRVDSTQTGIDPYEISLSGVDGEPGVSSNQKVFFIDGNLWLHNRRSYSFQFADGGVDGIQVTFVVKGNVYFSDNLFYSNAVTDGVAFIAMKDPDEADSGNIYFGDPEFGTLRKMQSYMYAENTFYDVNLDEDGSTIVELTGIMSAGDTVDIQRDYGEEHTKLLVEFDPRVANGTLSMPGLPPLSGAGGASYEVISWRRVALP